MTQKRWKWFLALSLLLGLLLRTLYVGDMEYKEDEQYDFTQSQVVGVTEPWPGVGMPSGVYVRNPGMSVWVFAALARVSHAHTPTQLATALQLFSLLGIALVIPFAHYLVKKEERHFWYWACALACVNPFAVFYQRKLWPEPFLPFFTMLMFMGYWKRSKWQGAMLWGFIGAWLGQIHMSGFFFAAGIFLWTLIFERKSSNWIAWFAGSTLGALTLIPWAIHVLSHPAGGTVFTGWGEAVQFKFWVFWITDALGLTLGNPLGLLRGQSNWAQISDFVRYPVLSGHATYLTGGAHLVVIACALMTYLRKPVGLSKIKDTLIGRESLTAFAICAGFFGFGLLMTLSTVVIRRYYMMVCFPLEFLFLARLAHWKRPNPTSLLLTLWFAQAVISANFVGYIHVHGGAPEGDYGISYRLLPK